MQNVAMSWIAWRRLGIRTYAGIGQFRDAWYWLRGEQSCRVHRGGLYALIEHMLRPVENLFCALARIRIVECFGGPSVRVFSWINRCGCVKGIYFRCTAIVGSKKSVHSDNRRHTGIPGTFPAWLSRLPHERALIFMPDESVVAHPDQDKTGEEDTGTPEHGDQVLHEYLTFLNSQIAKGYNIALMILPKQCNPDNATRGGEVSGGGHSVTTLQHGWETACKVNEILRQWATLNRVYLIDLDASLSGKQSADRRDEPIVSNGDSKSVDFESLSQLLCRLLDTGEFRDWLCSGNQSTRVVK